MQARHLSAGGAAGGAHPDAAVAALHLLRAGHLCASYALVLCLCLAL